MGALLFQDLLFSSGWGFQQIDVGMMNVLTG